MSEKQNRFLELDGLRAICVFSVIESHLIIGWFPEIPSTGIGWFLFNYFLNAIVGVQLFFVISGFIITYRLIIEQERSGKIDIFAFYVRRFSKLLPPVLFLLGGVIAITLFYGLKPLPLSCVTSVLTFTTGFFSPCGWDLSHLWSLSSEEFFYAVWPMAFCLVPLLRTRLRYALGVCALCSLMRIVSYKYSANLPFALTQTLKVLSFADHMMIGALLAFWKTDPSKMVYLEKMGKSSFLFLCVIAISGPTALSSVPGTGLFLIPFGQTTQALGCALLINICLSKRDSIFKRFLRLPILVWTGMASYSIYLVQQPLVNRSYYRYFFESPWLYAILSVGFCIAVGSLSFQFIEKPSIKLASTMLRNRKRVSSPPSEVILERKTA